MYSSVHSGYYCNRLKNSTSQHDWIAQLVDECTGNAKVMSYFVQSSVSGLRVDRAVLIKYDNSITQIYFTFFRMKAKQYLIHAISHNLLKKL